jgi:hypothetical protein
MAQEAESQKDDHILHAVDVLSRFSFVRADPRFREMIKTVCDQADADGRYTAASMYHAWKGWSFADKKTPSPWLTFLVERIRKRTIYTTARSRPTGNTGICKA